MNHVNLNTASDAVRQVILSFTANGTVFELDGRPVACLIPPPTPADDSEEWSNTKNTRRFYLIDKEIDGSITAEEAIELEDLTWQLRRYVNKVAPFPLDRAHQLLSELVELANQKSASGTPSSGLFNTRFAVEPSK